MHHMPPHEIFPHKKAPFKGPEAVEKVAKRHFFEFFHPVLAPMARSAPNAKYENLWVFIRSDAHVVRAGLNIRGCGPLSTLGFFDRLRPLLRGQSELP